MATYTYSSDDFILKRKYNISNETFTMKKVKGIDKLEGKKSYLFLNTDLPSLLSIHKESPTISNFNVKECTQMLNLADSSSYLFLFKENIIIGSLSNSQSQNIITKHLGKQIYGLKSFNFYNQNYLALSLEDKKDENSILINSQFNFVILDRHNNEVCRYQFERENEVCFSFVEVQMNFEYGINSNIYNNKKIFALGSGIMESTTIEPEYGFIHLIQLDENFKFTKLLELETKGGVYKMATQGNLLYVAICSTLFVYSIEINSKSKQFEIKLLRKNNDFTIINDLYCSNIFKDKNENILLVSDVYKSITVFKFDVEKEKLIEQCRDFNPIWCYSMAQTDNNMYLVSDVDGNVFTLRRELQPRSDEEKYKLERIAQFNFGERINRMINVSKTVDQKDWENIFSQGGSETSGSNRTNGLKVLNLGFGNNEDKKKENCNANNNNQINLTYFGTLEGSFGIIASLPKETYEFLMALQKEILKTVSSTGSFEYEKWRAFKVSIILYSYIYKLNRNSYRCRFLNLKKY